MSLGLCKTNWQRVALGQVVRHVTDRIDIESSGLDRFLAGEHIPSGNLTITDWGIIGRDPIGPMFYKRFKPGHVLYVSRRTYLRKVAVADFDGITGEKTFVLESAHPGLLQDFLPYVLSAEVFHSYSIKNSRGSVNPYLNWGELCQYEFDLPSVGEQRRISDLLWAVTRHMDSLMKLASRLVAVEDRLLATLLGRRECPIMPMSAIGDILMGRQKSPKHAGGTDPMPYLRVANIGDGQLRLGDIKVMNFTNAEQKRYRIHPGDILISEGQSRNLVGQSVLIEEGSLPVEMCFQNTLIRFRPNGRIRPRYAQALFRSCVRAGVFSEIATQTTSIAHLGVKRFAELALPIPGLTDQDRFLESLESVQEFQVAVEAESASAKIVSTTLLREIFGG